MTLTSYIAWASPSVPWFALRPILPSFMQFKLGFINLPPIRDGWVWEHLISLCLSVQPGHYFCWYKILKRLVSMNFMDVHSTRGKGPSTDHLWIISSLFLVSTEMAERQCPSPRALSFDGRSTTSISCSSTLSFWSFRVSTKVSVKCCIATSWLFLKPCFWKQFLNFSFIYHMEKW